MHISLPSIFLSLLLFFVFNVSNLVSAQDMSMLQGLDANQLSLVEDQLGVSSGISSPNSNKGKSNSYLSIENRNLVQQIKRLDRKELLEQASEDIQNKRIKLAIELCQQDEKACFLVEQYQQYKESLSTSEEIEIFGLNLFSGYPLAFETKSNASIKDSYIINIGDEFRVVTLGQRSNDQILTVDEYGNLVGKNFGPVSVAGLTLGEAKKLSKDWYKERFLSDAIYIALEATSSLQIYTIGLVKSPGLYTLSSTAKALNAIIASGGFTKQSSLRDVSILREGEIISSFDLYDLLIFGNSLTNTHLMEGDSVLINARKNSVTVKGEVIRPAIYEFKEGETLKDAINFSLGVTSNADISSFTITRFNKNGQKEIFDADYAKAHLFSLESGDEINVNSFAGDSINLIEVYGEIKAKGIYSYSNQMKLGDIFNIERDLLSDTYAGFAIIKRKNSLTKTNEILTFDFLSQDSIDNFLLSPNDKIYIFSNEDIDFLNSKMLKSYINSSLNFPEYASEYLSDPEKNYEEIECLSAIDSFGSEVFLNSFKLKTSFLPSTNINHCSDIISKNPELTPILINNSVIVSGSVRSEGIYPLTASGNADFLLKYAGGSVLNKNNSPQSIEIGTYDQGLFETTLDQLINFNNLYFVNIKIPNALKTNGFVRLVGEFNSPGIYPIDENTTLLEVYERAGGLRDNAFPLGAVFTRVDIIEREERMLQKIESELVDILASAITSGVLEQSPSELSGLITLMNNVGSAEATGRLITELNPQKIFSDPSLDIILQAGDTIYMPEIQNTVTVAGSVLSPITAPYDPRMSVNDYLKMAGGMKDNADNRATYIIYPNGIAKNVSSRIPFLGTSDILPGSSIIVPRKARPLSGLALVEAVSPVLANLSISLASINSITSSN